MIFLYVRLCIGNYVYFSIVTAPSHLEGSSTSVGRPGSCQSPVLAIENVDVCQPILLDVSFDGIMYLNFGFPLGLTPSTTMSSTVLVVWLSSLRLTCPYQRSRFCIRPGVLLSAELLLLP